jgi:glutathione S-transferase
MIGQTANILLYLGPRLRLTLTDEPGRLWVNQMQLTLADLSDEAHDTHHPLDKPFIMTTRKRRPFAERRDFAGTASPSSWAGSSASWIGSRRTPG